MKLSPKLQQDLRLLLSIAALVTALAVVIQPRNDYAFIAMMVTGLLNSGLNASNAIAEHNRARSWIFSALTVFFGGLVLIGIRSLL